MQNQPNHQPPGCSIYSKNLKTFPRHLLLSMVFLYGLLSNCGASHIEHGELTSEGRASWPLDQYSPELGVGTNFAETQTFRRCVTTPVLTTSYGFEDRRYHESQITSRKDINKLLDISASASAKGLWGSGHMGTSHYKGVDINEDSFYWVVDAQYDLAKKSIDTGDASFDLTPAAKAILQGPHGIENFYAACGHYFYSSFKLGAHYGLLYELYSREDKTIKRIKAGGHYKGFGAKIKAEFDKLSEWAQKSQVLKIHSLIEGGDNTLLDYAADADELKNQLEVLRDQLYNQGKGVVTHWAVSGYHIFPEVREAAKVANHLLEGDHFRREALAWYYERYTQNISKLQHLRSLLEKSSGDEPLLLFTVEDQKHIGNVIHALSQQNKDISLHARRCLNDLDNDCSISNLDAIVYTIPKPQKDMSTLGSWTVSIIPHPDSSIYVNFSARPSQNFQSRSYFTGYRLLQFDDSIALSINGEDSYNPHILIGDTQQVRDERTGFFRPNVCIGESSNFCTLRIIEDPVIKLDDGSPSAKLQLIIFSKLGFVTDQLSFRSMD